MHPTASDVAGFLLFGGFGVWWLLYPTSVRRSYTWFHRGRVHMPSDRGIRIAGAIWLCLMMVVCWRTFGPQVF